MYLHRCTAGLLLLLLSWPSNAQVDGILQINNPLQLFLERQQTRGLLDGAILSHQPLSAYEANAYLDSLAADAEALQQMSAVDRKLLARFRGEAPGPGVEFVRQRLRGLYRNGQDFFSTEGDDYGIQVSPVLYLDAARASQSTEEDPSTAGESADAITSWRNTRGIRAAGHLGDHLFFETRVEENQRVDPVADRTVVNQRIGLRYFRDGRLFDYWVVTGVAGVRTRYVEIRVGRDRNLWSAGRGALLVSNFPTTYDQVQLRTRVWRLQYTNVFASLSDPSIPRDSVTSAIRDKYGVFHRLAIDLPGRVQIGLSEASILAPTAEDRGPGFYMAYFNPIIFLRAVDFQEGSPANMLIALDAQWVATSGVQVYGQFMLDEFRAAELFSGNGWINNKWGALAGVHIVGIGVPDLELRAEYARVRPYTYSSVDSQRALVHHLGIVGHPYGPNAESVALWADYRPSDRITASIFATAARRGRNDGDINWGGDPLVPYTQNFPREFGVTLGQGIRQTETRLEGRFGFELLPNLIVEATAGYTRIGDAGNPALARNYTSFGGGLRWSLPYSNARF
ncbi:MAG: hypothetical protein IH855_04245 [Bacteroidetes bacterium]|nr:hypothetical protein [Bacteroidota bacterium]